jgi:hypothetical protein
MQISKISFKKLVLLGLIFCGILTSALAAFSGLESVALLDPKIKVADKATSEQFKLAAGYDRLVYFEKLQNLITLPDPENL